VGIARQPFGYNQPIVAAFFKRTLSFLVTASLVGWTLTLASCAYRLPAFTLPSQELVRIVTKKPEQYTAQVDTGRVNEYEVPPDGRVKVGIPPYRSSCGVYLFNVVKVGGYDSPLKAWSISIARNGKTVRKLSVQAVRELAADQAGYHILKIKD
jgi:hypothetical protein